MRAANSYESFLVAAAEYDALVGHDQWRREPRSLLYDYEALRKRREEVEALLDAASRFIPPSAKQDGGSDHGNAGSGSGSGSGSGKSSSSSSSSSSKENKSSSSSSTSSGGRRRRKGQRRSGSSGSSDGGIGGRGRRRKGSSADTSGVSSSSSSSSNSTGHAGHAGNSNTAAFRLMFRLRGGLGRQDFGLLHEGLFMRARAGTKHEVEAYLETVTRALRFLAGLHLPTPPKQQKQQQQQQQQKSSSSNSIRNNSPSAFPSSSSSSSPEADAAYEAAEVAAFLAATDGIALDAKLAFFNEIRHAYGRSALLLSGGAALGLYHIGVCRALAAEGMLPRVVNGASAG